MDDIMSGGRTPSSLVGATAGGHQVPNPRPDLPNLRSEGAVGGLLLLPNPEQMSLTSPVREMFNNSLNLGGDPESPPQSTPKSAKANKKNKRPSSGTRNKGLKKLVLPKHPEKPASSPSPLRDLDSKTNVTIGEQKFVLDAADLEMLHSLGRGAYGDVDKMRHKPTGINLAVKKIRRTLDSEDEKRLWMDLDVNMKTIDCPFAVKCYGALFKEGDVMICMELMDVSLDKFYRMVKEQGKKIPEEILSKIAYSVIRGLQYLKVTLHIMHRDVKPSNILLCRNGAVKICDYGISGHLDNSLCKTHIGSNMYMAPEKIQPASNDKGYDVRADIWSLGLTMYELAKLEYPYAEFENIFHQIKEVVCGPAPSLSTDTFSPALVDFVQKCLCKDRDGRPRYADLLEHAFITEHVDHVVDVAGYACDILDHTL